MQNNESQSAAHVMWSPRGPSGGDTVQQPPPATLCGALPLFALLTTTLATDFHRFLARFSGRRRIWPRISLRSGPPWALLVLVATSLLHMAEGCSSRTTPKPRPPAPTPRPNITFHTYVCPPAYATWYCLNGATCFTVKIGDSLLYNCECADGYMGPRCEYKDLDGSYLPSQRRFMLETASIAGGVMIAVLLVVILFLFVYVHFKRKAKQARTATDCVDGPAAASLHRHPTFGTRWKPQHHQNQQQQLRTDQQLAINDGDGGGGGVGAAGDVTITAKTDLHQVTTLLPRAGSGEHLA